MSVTISENKIIYDGNGSTRVWSYTFPIPDEDYLQVYITEPDGSPELITTGYKVNLEDKTVTYPSNSTASVLAKGYTITLLRIVPLTQPAELPNQQGKYFARNAEKGLDWLEFQIQQLAEETGRALKAPVDESYSAEDMAQSLIDSAEAAAESAKDAATSASESASSATASASSASLSQYYASLITLGINGIAVWDAETDYTPPMLVYSVEANNLYTCIEANGPSSTVVSPDEDEGRYWIAIAEGILTLADVAEVLDMSSDDLADLLGSDESALIATEAEVDAIVAKYDEEA